MEPKDIQCRICKGYQRVRVDRADYRAWKNGKLIQEAMPYLSDSERELLISGICGHCFGELFGGRE